MRPRGLKATTAIILAGGQSRRMGRDKAYVEIAGEPQIVRLVEALRPVFGGIIISANAPCPYRWPRVKVVPDIFPGCGPLAGIYSGLQASGSFYNFVVACDMPCVNTDLVGYMYSLRRGFDIVVPYLKKGPEPLFAVYAKSCLGAIEEMLVLGERRVQRFLERVKTRRMVENEISRFGSPDDLFANMNTLRDVRRIARCMERSAC